MPIGNGLAFLAVSVALVGMGYFNVHAVAIIIVGIIGFCAASSNHNKKDED